MTLCVKDKLLLDVSLPEGALERAGRETRKLKLVPARSAYGTSILCQAERPSGRECFNFQDLMLVAARTGITGSHLVDWLPQRA